jgi:hypothetical protein
MYSYLQLPDDSNNQFYSESLTLKLLSDKEIIRLSRKKNNCFIRIFHYHNSQTHNTPAYSQARQHPYRYYNPKDYYSDK